MHAARAEYLTVPKYHAVRFAAYLTIVGTVEDSEAQQLFWALKLVFFHRKRQSRWDAGLRALPVVREELIRITQSVHAYHAVRGRERIESAAFRLDDVVGVMAQLPDPKAYVQYVTSSGQLLRFSAVFHPNTLANARKHMRGLMGELAEMTVRHTEATNRKLRITHGN